MFRFLTKKADESVKKFSGQTDFLEGVCAAAALIAAADGDIEDVEITATKKAVTACKLLAGFDGRTVDQCIDTMLDRAGGGRVGRAGLWTEIAESAKDPEKAEAILLTALDIAESDGEIEPQERVVLERLAKDLRLDLARYEAA